jgi:hypothetical protein
MPVTIGTLTSNVNVVDGPDRLNDEMIERLIKLVLDRLNQETQAREQSLQESEVRDRMSEHD